MWAQAAVCVLGGAASVALLPATPASAPLCGGRGGGRGGGGGGGDEWEDEGGGDSKAALLRGGSEGW
jgi:hypothetical protein